MHGLKGEQGNSEQTGACTGRRGGIDLRVKDAVTVDKQ
jgi:hypothetical protein